MDHNNNNENPNKDPESNNVSCGAYT